MNTHDAAFDTAGAASTPVQASGVRKSGYLLVKGRPCKITT
jgi:hypothetical protein